MMKYVFSPRQSQFFLKEWEDDYRLAGTWPDDAVEISDEVHEQFSGQPPSGKVLGTSRDGLPGWVDASPESLEQLATRKRNEIEESLATELEAGMPYTMPNGKSDVVQMRDEDRQNLMGLAIQSRALSASGENSELHEFRADSNARYQMTPVEVIAMTDAAMAYYKQLLKHSWDKKDAIDRAVESNDRSTLELIRW